MGKRQMIGTVVIGMLLGGAIFRFDSVAAASANISHSYQASTTITNGSIVSLDPNSLGYVQMADVSNGSRLIGVALNSSDSLLAVDPSAGKVQIATSGSVSTLVSTINGNIRVGDQVGVSPFEGIGMEALTGSKVIGIAQTSFSSNTPGAVGKQVKDKNGHVSNIEVGYIQVNIALGTDGDTIGEANLSGLQKLAKAITGHVVSTTRVAVSVAIAAVAILALVTLIYTSISSSILSIGRNPLARHSIYRSLSSVMITAFMMIFLASLTIFFLLR